MAPVRVKCLGDAHGARFAAYHGDSVDVLRQFPESSIGFSVFSPPFANLFVYSDAINDMGNVADDAEFFAQYDFLVRELYRVTQPGRLAAVHCSDIPSTKWRDGVIGIRDFSGKLIAAHAAAGWTLHGRVTIWKCPVVEMTRTKALGLLYKQIQKDSSRSRPGMPDYLLIFRKDGENADPIRHTPEEFPLQQWQEWASPVWMTVDQGNVLNTALARTEKDERHLCPLQLDVIQRACALWSNPGDAVLSPFMGIGSEGVVALRMRRRFIGVELKEEYFRQAVGFLEAEDRQGDLFSAAEAAR